MKYAILLLSILFLGAMNKINLTYTASTNPIEFKIQSCQTEQIELAITMLINSESRNQSWKSKKENFKNLNARVKDYRFPNNFIDVIYQHSQYDGVNTKYFKYNQEIADSVKIWLIQDEVGYLYYYNPDYATDTTFVNWSNQFTHYIIEDHHYFGLPKFK